MFGGGCGRFLDIGSGNGLQGSNTATLENAGWNGVCVDLNAEAVEWNRVNRKSSKAVCADATICDWKKVLDLAVGQTITFDFISFDVDEATIPAVKHFPWDSVRFKVLTIEHDAYQRGPEARSVIRDVLSKHGYMLLAADVCADFNCEPYEDWWIDPIGFRSDMWSLMVSDGRRAVDVFMNAR